MHISRSVRDPNIHTTAGSRVNSWSARTLYAVLTVVWANCASALDPQSGIRKLEDLAPYIGNRSCGTVTASGEATQPQTRIEWTVSKGLEGSWLVGRAHIFDDAASGESRETIELMGVHPSGEHYIRDIYSGDGVVARLTSAGWVGNSMVWEGTITHPVSGVFNPRITVTFPSDGVVEPVYAFWDEQTQGWVNRIHERCETKSPHTTE